MRVRRVLCLLRLGAPLLLVQARDLIVQALQDGARVLVIRKAVRVALQGCAQLGDDVLDVALWEVGGVDAGAVGVPWRDAALTSRERREGSLTTGRAMGWRQRDAS